MIPLVLCFFAPFAYDQYVLGKIALAAALVLIAGLHRGFRAKPLSVPILLMLAAVAVSALISGDPVNIWGRYMARYLGLLPLGVCWLAYSLAPNPAGIERPVRVAAGLLAAYGLSQLVWSPLGYNVLSTGSRIIGSMGSPPALGCALAMCLPFCLNRQIWLGMIVVAAILATGSRGPVLAALVVIAMNRYDDPAARRAAAAVALCLATGGLTLLLLGHGASDAIRIMTWKSALQVWWAHPLFGCGAESYVDAWRQFRTAEWAALAGPSTYQDHAHNDFLEALAAFGLVGFIAYCNMLWATWKVARGPHLAAVVAVFICAKFNAVPFAVLFALALILGSLDEGEPELVPIIPQLAALSLALFAAQAFYADILFYKTRRALDYAGIERAAKLNPDELFYQAHMADLLTRKYAYTGDEDLLTRALEISNQALLDHPGSVQAQHVKAQTLIFIAQRDPYYISDARKAAEVLYTLDPMANYRFRIVVK